MVQGQLQRLPTGACTYVCASPTLTGPLPFSNSLTLSFTHNYHYHYRYHLQPAAAQASAFESSKGVGSDLLDSLTSATAAGEDDKDSEDDSDLEEGKAGVSAQPHREVFIDIHDDDDLGDDRIDPHLLKLMLRERPELANLLYDCAEEEGLLDVAVAMAENGEGDEPSIHAEEEEE